MFVTGGVGVFDVRLADHTLRIQDRRQLFERNSRGYDHVATWWPFPRAAQYGNVAGEAATGYSHW